MSTKRFWATALIVVCASLTLGQFSRSYWKYHSANSMQAWSDDIQYSVLPTCPTDRSVLEFGALCKDITTGKIFYRGTLEAIP